MQRFLAAPYGHTSKLLKNGDFQITLHGVKGGDVTRVGRDWGAVATECLNAAERQSRPTPEVPE